MTAMETVLSELPEDIRQSARLLWRRAERVTTEATETLLYSYKVLGAIPGDTALLSEGSDLLRTSVVSELNEIVTELTRVGSSWTMHGPGRAARPSTGTCHSSRSR